MYEKKSQPPLTGLNFSERIIRHISVAFLLILGSLALGMLGYMYFENLSAVDAFLNATMLLGGMGPVNAPQTTGGKLFAGCYALYAGMVFIVTSAILFTPVLHRLLHHFHWKDKG